MRGSSIRCAVDGEPVIDARDDLFPSGSVGFVTYKGRDVRFDDVRVTRP